MSNLKELQRLEENFARVMKAQQFVFPAFSLYGGASGFQTYGVQGKVLFDKIIEVWRRMFVHDLTDNLNGTSVVFEIDSPIVTPKPILKASGHVDRFTDPIVYDAQGRLERVDHYLKKMLNRHLIAQPQKNMYLAQIEGGRIEDLQKLLEEFGEKGRKFGPIQEANLMLSTQTSYSDNISYLRPETAQDAFTEFKNLFTYNREKLPFGIVNIGKAYRKEVSPVPFTRMREFYQAELEYFYDPDTLADVSDLYQRMKDKKKVFNMTLINITTAEEPDQIQRMPIIDLIRNNIIQNELIFKFVVRALMFCFRIGIDPDRLRLRQHMEDELAHYSSDCWDVEFDMSYANSENSEQWLEIIGISDRGTYDLSAHQQDTNQSMRAKRYFDAPKEVERIEVVVDPKYWGKTYRADARTLLTECERQLLSNPDQYVNSNENGDDTYTIVLEEPIISKWNKNDDGSFAVYHKVTFKSATLRLVKRIETITYEEFVPSVIEPSFGLDRIFYSVLRSAFKIRDTEKENETDPDRTFMSFDEEVCPIRYGVISLINSPEHMEYVKMICDRLDKDVSVSKSYRVDTSGVSIGKKYARLDEMGVNIVFTVDNQTLEDETFTVRYRDSMEQSRLHLSSLNQYLKSKIQSAADSNIGYRDICDFD